MFNHPKVLRTLRIVGIATLLVGVLDPMEGSVVIAAGGALLVWHAYLINNRAKVLYLMAGAMIAFGVLSLFALSSIGGFGGTTGVSVWWGLLIVPYPAGWLLMMVLLVSNLLNKNKTT